MNFIRRFIYSPTAVTISAAIGKILIFFSISILSHTLSKTDYGEFSFIYMLVGIGQFFSGLSLHEASLRYSLKYEEHTKRLTIYNRCFTVSLFLSILVALVSFLITMLFTGYSTIFLVLLTMLVLNQVYLYCISYVRLIEDNLSYQLLLVFPSFLACIFSLMLMTEIIGLGCFLLLYSFIYVFPGIIFLKVKRSKKLKLAMTKLYYDKAIFKFGLTVSFTNAISQLTLISDSFIVSSLASIESFADYRNATLIAISVLFIPSVFCSVFYSKIAKAQTSLCIYKIYFDIVKFTLPLALLIALPIIFYSDFIVGLVFGYQYVDTVSPIMEVTAYIIFVSFVLRTPVGNILQARGLVSFNFKLSLFGLAFNFVFSILALMYLDLTYVAWVSFLTSLLISTISAYYLFVDKNIIERSQLSILN